MLHAILGRQYTTHFHETWEQVFRAVLQESRVEMLKRVYLSAVTQSDDIDDAKYTLQKKLAEVRGPIPNP